MTESLPGGIVSTIPWLKLTTELSNSEIDLMISTLILPLSSTTLKPSDNTELLDWLRLNEPQILENVEAVFEDVEDKVEAVNVLALRCKVFFRFFLEAISRRLWGVFLSLKAKKIIFILKCYQRLPASNSEFPRICTRLFWRKKITKNAEIDKTNGENSEFVSF